MNIDIQKNISLAPYTTFKIGGPVKFFVEVCDKNKLVDALQWAKDNRLEIFVLGGGSNLLVSDKGFDGLIIRVHNTKYEIQNNFDDNEDYVSIKCGAGVNLSALALDLSKNNLSGLEWSVGIPRATVGGAIRGNAEAFNVAIGDLVREVEVFNIIENKFKFLDKDECKFDYRESIFKKNKDYLIWSAILKLKKANRNAIDNLIKKSIDHRQKKYPKMPNAGSVFKNTISFEELKKHNKELADYILRSGIVSRLGNVATGFLIDELGLKGKKIGGAKISEKHANFIVNTGNATAEDIIMLMSLIKQKVRDNFGIQLEEEIQTIGF